MQEQPKVTWCLRWPQIPWPTNQIWLCWVHLHLQQNQHSFQNQHPALHSNCQHSFTLDLVIPHQYDYYKGLWEYAEWKIQPFKNISSGGDAQNFSREGCLFSLSFQAWMASFLPTQAPHQKDPKALSQSGILKQNLQCYQVGLRSKIAASWHWKSSIPGFEKHTEDGWQTQEMVADLALTVIPSLEWKPWLRTITFTKMQHIYNLIEGWVILLPLCIKRLNSLGSRKTLLQKWGSLRGLFEEEHTRTEFWHLCVSSSISMGEYWHTSI